MANVGSFTSTLFENADFKPKGTPFSPDWNDKLSGTTKQNGLFVSANVNIISENSTYIASTRSNSSGIWSITNLPKQSVNGKKVIAYCIYDSGEPAIFNEIDTVA